MGSIDEGQVDSMLGDLQVVLPKAHREKIKEIILTRWAVARDLGIVS